MVNHFNSLGQEKTNLFLHYIGTASCWLTLLTDSSWGCVITGAGAEEEL